MLLYDCVPNFKHFVNICILLKIFNMLQVGTSKNWTSCVPKIPMIWYTVPEIRIETDRNVCNFEPFFFLPFSPLTTQKIKFSKLKESPGDIIFLHICTINDNRMMYGSWDMERDRHNFMSFWTVVCPMDPQNQNFEKIWKASEYIIILQMCTRNDTHIMYGSWDTECNGHNFLLFCTVFCTFTPIAT